MRLFGVTMVRNEADVIEAFVRHNISVLDGLTIVDHGSIDGTLEILANLQAEGLPLWVQHEANPIFRQSEIITAFVRDALVRERADFVFALDADEFLKVASRSELEHALAHVPPGSHAAMHWPTYVPDDFAAGDGAFGPGHLWWRLKTERRTRRKVIASRALIERPGDVVTIGNHYIRNPAAPPNDAPPRVLLRQDVVALAHCPVRSRTQLEGKIIVGYLAHLATQPDNQLQAHHWRALYNELSAGATLTEERLRVVACNYGLPRENWLPLSEIDLVEDPIPFVFAQRYRVDVAPTSLQLLLRFTEELIATFVTDEKGRPANAASPRLGAKPTVARQSNARRGEPSPSRSASRESRRAR